MDFKAIKWQILHGSLTWRVVIRGLFFVLAMAVVTWTRIASEMRTNDDDELKMLLNFEKCSLNVVGSNNDVVYGKNLSVAVVKELMNKEVLRFDSRALCVGEDSDMIAMALRELGLDAVSVYTNPILSLLRKELVGKLGFDANSFDFVFSASLERASVPALVVLEIERVLRPGGVGVMLVGSGGYNTRSLVRSATPVSLLLRSSEILHVCGISAYTLIVFKKQLESVAYFENYKLPSECPSIAKNKPFMEFIEPIVEDQRSGNAHEIAYLPKFLNISARSRLIYINMGAGGFDQRYPIHPDAFNVYVVDHNVSALTSHVKKPGVTFVYHPGLVEDDMTESSLMSADYLEAPLHEEQFEFIDWFRETAKNGDFVVLTMNAGVTQLKVLVELFASGAICHVDELFLRCSDGVDCRTSYCRDCTSLYNGLRNAGVFVHQWLGD